VSILSPNFFIGTIKINSVEGASCINLGNNFPTNFTNHKKHNQGFGNVSGNDNKLDGLKNVVSDPDFIDMLNLTEDEIPEWLKEVILKGEKNTSKSK
jgi:hypothetical protein